MLNGRRTFIPQDATMGLDYTALHSVIITLSCSEIPWFNLSLCETERLFYIRKQKFSQDKR